MNNIIESTILQTINANCENLQKTLKAKKLELHLTNQEISDRTGVPVDTVRKYFAGESKSPNVYNIMSICILMELSLDELLGNNTSVTVPSSVNDRINKLESENHDLKIHLEYAQKSQTSLESVTMVRQKIIYALLSICSLLTVFICVFIMLDRQIGDYGLFQNTHTNPLGLIIILSVFASIIVIAYVVFRLMRRKRNEESGTEH